jgi:hypothetical protein
MRSGERREITTVVSTDPGKSAILVAAPMPVKLDSDPPRGDANASRPISQPLYIVITPRMVKKADPSAPPTSLGSPAEQREQR